MAQLWSPCYCLPGQELKNTSLGNSLVVQLVGFRALSPEGVGSITDEPPSSMVQEKKKKTSESLNLYSKFARVILILVPGRGHRMGS